MRNALSDISTDLDDETLHNASLLRDASCRGNVDEVKSLIEKLGRMNLDLKNTVYDSRFIFQSSALMYAAQFGHSDVVSILIDAGAKVDDEEFDDRFLGLKFLAQYGTALMRAAGSGNLEIVNKLIEAGANVNGIALILAVENFSYFGIIKLAIIKECFSKTLNNLGYSANSSHKNGFWKIDSSNSASPNHSKTRRSEYGKYS
jgi:ankyrin repeat protein